MAAMQSAIIPTFIYGTAWKEEHTAALTELALRAGFRAIDTANQRKHYFEAGIGEALAAGYRTGVVTREDVFLQTKFTYQRGQDHRLPYNPAAPLATQVAQSLASSLDHLGTDRVDSFVLHGTISNDGWTEHDAEVWQAMRGERDADRTKWLGVSNIGLEHLEQMKGSGTELPKFVQNRCFARSGWDREVREFCNQHKIVYQAFSLLTANREVLEHPPFIQMAAMLNASPAQVIFAFARQVGMIPLTGTSSADHMKQDLDSLEVKLPEDLVNAIESIAG
ncbi:MAG: aldo/keto reductase family protein [Candidatus Sulfotelmatobacter sp.]